MCDCLRDNLQKIRETLQENEEINNLHVSYNDTAVSFQAKSGLSVQAFYCSSNNNTPSQIQNENFFLPFAYCPFCGQSMKDEVLEDTPQMKEDKEAYAIFLKLENDLENTFDNIIVKDLNEAYEKAYEILEQVNLEFTLTKFNEEKRMEILYKGHHENHSIELILVGDEDEENIYTVTVF